MKYFLTYSFLILLFSCSTSIKDSPKTETKELEEKATIKNSKNKGTKASGLTKKREFQIQPIQPLKNTTWVNSPFPNCTDTLNITANNSYYYSCEHDLVFDIELRIDYDTLYIDKYGLVSDVTVELGSEIKSKYKMIKSNDMLILVGIAHKYQDKFQAVGEEYLYQEFKILE